MWGGRSGVRRGKKAVLSKIQGQEIGYKLHQKRERRWIINWRGGGSKGSSGRERILGAGSKKIIVGSGIMGLSFRGGEGIEIGRRRKG